MSDNPDLSRAKEAQRFQAENGVKRLVKAYTQRDSSVSQETSEFKANLSLLATSPENSIDSLSKSPWNIRAEKDPANKVVKIDIQGKRLGEPSAFGRIDELSDGTGKNLGLVLKSAQKFASQQESETPYELHLLEQEAYVHLPQVLPEAYNLIPDATVLRPLDSDFQYQFQEKKADGTTQPVSLRAGILMPKFDKTYGQESRDRNREALKSSKAKLKLGMYEWAAEALPFMAHGVLENIGFNYELALHGVYNTDAKAEEIMYDAKKGKVVAIDNQFFKAGKDTYAIVGIQKAATTYPATEFTALNLLPNSELPLTMMAAGFAIQDKQSTGYKEFMQSMKLSVLLSLEKDEIVTSATPVDSLPQQVRDNLTIEMATLASKVSAGGDVEKMIEGFKNVDVPVTQKVKDVFTAISSLSYKSFDDLLRAVDGLDENELFGLYHALREKRIKRVVGKPSSTEKSQSEEASLSVSSIPLNRIVERDASTTDISEADTQKMNAIPTKTLEPKPVDPKADTQKVQPIAEGPLPKTNESEQKAEVPPAVRATLSRIWTDIPRIMSLPLRDRLAEVKKRSDEGDLPTIDDLNGISQSDALMLLNSLRLKNQLEAFMRAGGDRSKLNRDFTNKSDRSIFAVDTSGVYDVNPDALSEFDPRYQLLMRGLLRRLLGQAVTAHSPSETPTPQKPEVDSAKATTPEPSVAPQEADKKPTNDEKLRGVWTIVLAETESNLDLEPRRQLIQKGIESGNLPSTEVIKKLEPAQAERVFSDLLIEQLLPTFIRPDSELMKLIQSAPDPDMNKKMEDVIFKNGSFVTGSGSTERNIFIGNIDVIPTFMNHFNETDRAWMKALLLKAHAGRSVVAPSQKYTAASYISSLVLGT